MQIKKIVQRHTQMGLPQAREVIAVFRRLLPLHGTGGIRRAHYLHTYSGKDLLIQMNDDLSSLGFHSFGEFRERILIGIRDTAEHIADWLPEWAALRNEIQTYTS